FTIMHSYPNLLTDLLRNTESNMSGQYDFFQMVMDGSKRLSFDLSSIFSRSEKINMAWNRHNADQHSNCL
ncbi:MAG: hypothetical protein QW203_03605, partial [Thermoplasmatales archaeon]